MESVPHLVGRIIFVIASLSIVAARSLAASQGTRQTPSAVTVEESAPECAPDMRDDLINPAEVTHLDFRSAESLCRSPKCLGNTTLSCTVKGWNDARNPLVECRAEKSPKNHTLSYTKVICGSEQGCVVKNSCKVEYELEEGLRSMERSSARFSYPEGVLSKGAIFSAFFVVGFVLGKFGVIDLPDHRSWFNGMPDMNWRSWLGP